MDSKDGRERRQHRRCSICQFLDVSLMHEHEVHVEVVNISNGGLLCQGPERVEPLSTVYLMLRFPAEPEDYIARIEGSVMHAKQEGDQWVFGVAFGPLTPQDEKVIAAYVDSHCPPG